MANKVIVEVEGRRYEGTVYMASVYGGRATVAVKGSVPISFPVTEILDDGNGTTKVSQ